MSVTIREPGSAITHFIGMMMAILASTPLLIKAVLSGQPVIFFAMVVFIASMILLYGASATYHSINVGGRILRLFRKLDHMMIFVLIAGSYTPVCLVVLGGRLGYTLLAVVWGGVLPMVIAFATVVFGAVATMRGGRRSAAGQNLTAQALGFRRYIQYLSTHQLTMQLRDNGLYFYDLLPFTEAMGLSDDLASRVGRFQMEPCPWFRARRKQPQTPPGFTAAFQDMLRRMDNSGR